MVPSRSSQAASHREPSSFERPSKCISFLSTNNIPEVSEALVAEPETLRHITDCLSGYPVSSKSTDSSNCRQEPLAPIENLERRFSETRRSNTDLQKNSYLELIGDHGLLIVAIFQQLNSISSKLDSLKLDFKTFLQKPSSCSSECTLGSKLK